MEWDELEDELSRVVESLGVLLETVEGVFMSTILKRIFEKLRYPKLKIRKWEGKL